MIGKTLAKTLIFDEIYSPNKKQQDSHSVREIENS